MPLPLLPHRNAGRFDGNKGLRNTEKYGDGVCPEMQAQIGGRAAVSRICELPGLTPGVTGRTEARISVARGLLLVGWMLCLIALPCVAAVPGHPQPLTVPLLSGPFMTPVTDALIDDAAAEEWVGGATHPVTAPVTVRQVLWTQTTSPMSGRPLLFGGSTEPGPRHLRIGFRSAIAVGSVLVRGGDQLSVLRPGANYPGDLANDGEWIAAARVVHRQPAGSEVGADEYALWVLPQGTETRALRLTHLPSATDQSYAGVLGGLYVLAGRFADVAPKAAVTASANQASTPLLTDLKENGWHAWDNGPTYTHTVTAATPEWIVLAWHDPVQLRGLATLFAGFNAAEVEVFNGPAASDPLSAPESQWQKAGSYALHSQYPRFLAVDWMDFGKTVETRAVRLRMTEVTDESRHPHLAGKTQNGRRVWLGELMAISPLGSGELKAMAVPNAPSAGPHAPIPIHFTLDAAANVTLVIDDAKGNRVRNLVSDTPFPAGANTVWWDGTDDLGRNPDAAAHGQYEIPTHFVEPGHYTVRGLAHGAIDLRYEFSVYSPGTPPWETASGTGGWLTNHTAGSAALFVPAARALASGKSGIGGDKPMVYLGSAVSEGGSALAWVDLDGHKQGGRGWIGGNWTGAPYMALDAGPRAKGERTIYVASVLADMSKPVVSNEPAELRLTALTESDRKVLDYTFTEGDKDAAELAYERETDLFSARAKRYLEQIGGLSVYDGIAVISLTMRNQLLLADCATGRVLGMATVENPRGSAFDLQGNLLVLSGSRLLRFAWQRGGATLTPAALVQPETVIAQGLGAQGLGSQGLEDPWSIVVDSDGLLYISDRGSSNQVKVFAGGATGTARLMRTIGRAGAPAAGPYDPLHMNNPHGIAIDSNRHLWVTEEDFLPKRVSEWTLDGKLLQAFYGPGAYGGGGTLDPVDKSRFYDHGLEFRLDWRTGSSTLDAVLYRQQPGDLKPPRSGEPNSVLHSNGRRYFTDSYLGLPTTGITVGLLYLDEGGVTRPVAALGKANDWAALQADEFKALLPPGSDLSSRASDKSVLFAWSDLNGDGKVEPNEVSFTKAVTGWITIAGADGQATGPVMLDSYVDGKAMRYAPVRMTDAGIPVYDLNHGAVVAAGAQLPSSDGGGQMLVTSQATGTQATGQQAIVLTTAPKPFSPEGLGGIDAHGHLWSYPSLWPGLHPSHSAPVPDTPGELAGTTRLLGGLVHAPNAAVGDLWGINGNLGDVYLFTADGLFVSQLFQDVRVGKPWTMPVAQRNMLLNDLSLHDENFYPSLTQTEDGNIYLVDGTRTSLVRVDGLTTLKRLPDIGLDLTRAQLTTAESYQTDRELARQQSTGAQSLTVTLRPGAAPALHELARALASGSSATGWATIDRRTINQGFANKPDVTDAAVTIAAGRLYAVFRGSDPNLLNNSGAVADAPFKTGGALDLMIGANPNADPQRKAAVAGDERLLVYQVNGQTHAMLYRPVVPGTAKPVPFSSPDRTITIDQVTDVSASVQLDAANGVYAISVPLETLGLHPAAGQAIQADLGILRGNGVQTTQRVYWSDKATGITADVPSEAQLTPALWGKWVFVPAR